MEHKKISPIRGIAVVLSILVSQAVGQGLPTAQPGEMGMSTERLDRIRPVLQQYVDTRKVTGLAAMVARRGKVVYFETFGQKSLDPAAEMGKSTIFRIYSMTKPVVSVAAMMLYEEGMFFLDDPVAKYLPELDSLRVYVQGRGDDMVTEEAERPITIRQLLTHTSGLASGISGNSFVDTLYREAGVLDRDDTLEETLGKLSRLPLLNQPDSKWYYGASLDVVAALVERLAGMPFDEFLSQRIFEPLEMTDTAYYVPTDKQHRLAGCYETDDESHWEPSRFLWADEYDTPPGLHAGGFGLVSTLSDYVRFGQMLLNGGDLDGVRLLSPKTVAFMLSDNLPDGMEAFPNHGFGLGFSVLKDHIKAGRLASTGAVGWLGAANTFFAIDPAEELIWMVWAQVFPCCQLQLNGQFETLVYQAIVD